MRSGLVEPRSWMPPSRGFDGPLADIDGAQMES